MVDNRGMVTKAECSNLSDKRETIARAIVQADEQNGGPSWDYLMTMGKHVVGPIWDRADAVIEALCRK
jgi:hypothetical protein